MGKSLRLSRFVSHLLPCLFLNYHCCLLFSLRYIGIILPFLFRPRSGLFPLCLCAFHHSKMQYLPSRYHVKLDKPWSRAGRQRDERKRLLAAIFEGAAHEAHRREEAMWLCREHIPQRLLCQQCVEAEENPVLLDPCVVEQRLVS